MLFSLLYCDEIGCKLEGEAAVNINRSNIIIIDKNVICMLVLAVLACWIVSN